MTTKTLAPKFKRLISMYNGNIFGWMVYNTSSDYQTREFAIAWLHPDDVYDKEKGKSLALEKLNVGETFTLDATTLLVDESYWYRGVDFDRLIKGTGLRYIPFRVQQQRAIKALKPKGSGKDIIYSTR